MDKDIAIYSFRISKSLINKGFILKNMELNSKIRGKIVFYFENTNDIKEVLSKEHGIKIE